MTIIQTIDTITEWVKRNICSKIELKRAASAEDREPQDDSYDYGLIHPAAFAMYVPTKDKLPPEVKADFPSVCVRLVAGKDAYGTRELNVELAFSTWNPGRHAQDIIYPGILQERQETYRENGEGWRDLWNFMEIALQEIGRSALIEGIVIDKDKPVEYGPFKEQDQITDYYPFWFGYVRFTVKNGLTGYVKDYDEFL